MAVIKDRRGRKVTLSERRWDHIVRRHPALDGFDLAVKTAIEVADTRRDGNGPGIEKLFAHNLGPAKWLVVVVAYDLAAGTGDVLTAYPQSKDPQPESEEA